MNRTAGTARGRAGRVVNMRVSQRVVAALDAVVAGFFAPIVLGSVISLCANGSITSRLRTLGC